MKEIIKKQSPDAEASIPDLRYLHNYQKFVQSLLKKMPLHEAMTLAPGGWFEVVGQLELALLVQLGLQKNHFVIDVGCSSGRLAKPLAGYLTGRYLGIDIVPEVVEYARTFVQRPDWRFETAKGLTIPSRNSKADMVCFFSVFTHLSHEHSFLYLKEAARVVKPGGTIVVSFLDFSVPSHWPWFKVMVETDMSDTPPNVFLSEGAFQAWAKQLDLGIEMMVRGDEPLIDLPKPLTMSDGQTIHGPASFGQSVCVLKRGPNETRNARSRSGELRAETVRRLKRALTRFRSNQHEKAFASDDLDQKEDLSSKQARLNRIKDFLICPECHGELRKNSSACIACGQLYQHTKTYWNFLTDDYRKRFAVSAADNGAGPEHDEIAEQIISRHADGLILDCGASADSAARPNVINYEAVAHPSADVLGISEKLPFRAETFDAVFLLNILEHVSDPFQAAQEVTRVLKRGGTLYCVVPFLQPLHGYPNHFYNMSGPGLRRLFERDFEILEHDVPDSGLPIWSLHWILKSWSEGLTGQPQQEFLDQTVRQLIANDPLSVLSRDFVSKLPSDKNFELASSTMILAKKT